MSRGRRDVIDFMSNEWTHIKWIVFHFILDISLTLQIGVSKNGHKNFQIKKRHNII